MVTTANIEDFLVSTDCALDILTTGSAITATSGFESSELFNQLLPHVQESAASILLDERSELLKTASLLVRMSYSRMVENKIIPIEELGFVHRQRALDSIIPEKVKAFFLQAEIYFAHRSQGTSRYALSLLERIKHLVGSFRPDRLDGRILTIVDGDDEYSSFEWIRNRSRLGFVLDNEHISSSWFLVLPNGSSKSGSIYPITGTDSLRGLIEEFITAGE